MIKIKHFCTIVLLLVITLSCEDDDFEPQAGEVTACNTFTFDGETFSLPAGRCEEGSVIDFDVSEDGDSFKFRIACQGSCIETVDTRE